jgi:DNA-binding winged helix-turn-helix (wHTH) protein/Flp pilus assembly protein TadD
MATDAFYEFDGYRLDPTQCVLFAAQAPIPLHPLTCELLRVFLNHPKRLLPLAFLIDRVWNGDLDTSDSAVAFQIYTLRQTLGDNAKSPKFIQTVRKRGFRFLREVRRTLAKSDAGEFYEKARHLYHKSAPHDILRAIDYYERIITLNREYVPDAYAGIAESYVLLGTFAHQHFSADEAMEKARAASLKAIALDGTLAEAWSALASVAALYDWQWAEARQHFAHALRLTSNPLVKPLVRSWYAVCLAARGDKTEARMEIDRAKADFATSFVLAALSGRIAYLARDPDTAIKECDEGITLEQHFFLTHVFKGHALRLRGDYPGAESAFERACNLSEQNPVCLAELAHIRGLQGRSNEATTILHALQHAAQVRYLSPYLFAHIYLGLGKLVEMFEWLEKAYEARAAYLVFLATDPIYDSVRRDPRFEHLVRRVHF